MMYASFEDPDNLGVYETAVCIITLDGDFTPLEAEREMWETEGAFWSGELLREGLLMSALWAILTPSVV